MTKRWVQPRIRVSVQGTVRTQDPNPSKILEGSIRATPLYEIVVLTLSHYIWYRSTEFAPAHRPPPPARSARLYFLGRWQTTLVGGPQSTRPSLHIDTRWFRVASLSFFLVRMETGLRHLTPRHMHTRYKVYVSRLLLRSYDFKRKWWCTMALPSATVHLLSLPPNWIYDNLRPVTPVPPDLLLWADRPLSGRTDFSK